MKTNTILSFFIIVSILAMSTFFIHEVKADYNGDYYFTDFSEFEEFSPMVNVTDFNYKWMVARSNDLNVDRARSTSNVGWQIKSNFEYGIDHNSWWNLTDTVIWINTSQFYQYTSGGSIDNYYYSEEGNLICYGMLDETKYDWFNGDSTLITTIARGDKSRINVNITYNNTDGQYLLELTRTVNNNLPSHLDVKEWFTPTYNEKIKNIRWFNTQPGIWGGGFSTTIRVYDVKMKTTSTQEYDSNCDNYDVKFIPSNDFYYWNDNFRMYITNYNNQNSKLRVINATGIEVIADRMLYAYSGQQINVFVSKVFGSGIWSLQLCDYDDDYGTDTTCYHNFTVNESTSQYYVYTNQDYYPLNSFIGITYNGFAGDHHRIELWTSSSYGNISSITDWFTDDREITDDYAFYIEDEGQYYIIVKDDDTGEIRAISNSFIVSDDPQDNYYVLSVEPSQIDYDETATLSLSKVGRKSWQIYIVRNDDYVYYQTTGNDDFHQWILDFNADKQGTYTIYVFDGDGTKEDLNAKSKTLIVGIPSDDTPYSNVADNIELWIGLIIILIFTFIGVGISVKAQFREPMPVILIFAVIGVLIATLMGLVPLYFIFIIGLLLIAYIVTKLMPSGN